MDELEPYILRKYYRTVLDGSGIIGTPEPYCEKHIKETQNIGDKLIPVDEYTNKECVICQLKN